MKDALIEKIREGVFDNLSNAKHHYNIFWQLIYITEDYPEIFEDYGLFIVFTTIAHNNCFITKITDIVTSDRRTANIYKLLNRMEKLNYITKSQFNIWTEQLNEYKKTQFLQSVIEQRNKIVVHNEVNINEPAKSLIMTIPIYDKETADDILKEIKEMVWEISKAYDGKFMIPELEFRPAYKCEEIVKNLIEYKELKKQSTESA